MLPMTLMRKVVFRAEYDTGEQTFCEETVCHNFQDDEELKSMIENIKHKADRNGFLLNKIEFKPIED